MCLLDSRRRSHHSGTGIIEWRMQVEELGKRRSHRHLQFRGLENVLLDPPQYILLVSTDMSTKRDLCVCGHLTFFIFHMLM